MWAIFTSTEFMVGFTIGAIVEAAVALVIRMIRSGTGCLKIDHSNPEKDLYRLEIDGDLDKIAKKKEIILRVDNNADLSQN